LEHIDEESGRWLDIGCGVGASVSYLDSLGWDAVGLDVSQHSIQAGKELFGVDLRQQTLIDFLEQNPNAEFDVVSFMGYFDVVSEPIPDIERATTLLGDKGHVAIGVQQFDSVSTLVQQTFNEQVTRHLIPPNIVQMFTHQSLQRTYEKLGVDQQAVWYFGLDFYTLLNNLCLSIDGFQESELYETLMTNYNEFQEVIDRNKKSDYLLTVGRYSDE
jgi:SAM-dependent methyltransferase